MAWRVIFCILLVQSTLSAKRTYAGDKALRIQVTNAEQWSEITDILDNNLPVEDVDIWHEPDRHGYATVFVPSAYSALVMSLLREQNVDFTVQMDDVGRIIDEVNQANEELRASRMPHAIVGTYATYSEIQAWMAEVVALHPELASTEEIGRTFENRPMKMLTLNLKPGVKKWRVWLEGGAHAREWVSPATTIFVADKLIQGYRNNDPEILDWLNNLEFNILPVANPDGYEYCFTNERLWRKNRRPHIGGCVGVDLNRNWDFHWGEVGSSADPCSNLYKGVLPNSEPEVEHMARVMFDNKEDFIWYHSYHSWGMQFFTRWDYTSEEVPPDDTELSSLAVLAARAISDVHQMDYEAGRAPDIMYAFSGSSSDWARGVANIKYPYLTELRDNGTYSFILPPEQIIPTGQENYAGFEVVARHIMNNYGNIIPG